MNRLCPLFLLLLMPAVLSARTKVMGVRFWSGPEHTRVVLDLSAEVAFQTGALENGPRVYVDLLDSSLMMSPPIHQVEVGDGLIVRLRLAQNSKDTVRLVADLNASAPYEAFLVPPSEEKPHRLVLDILRSDSEGVAALPEPKMDEKVRVVVLDPGHGGEDPGALGWGLREKDVMLDVAKRVSRHFEAQKNVACLLTRKGDYDVSLRRRRELLEKWKGDIFISLHTNASRSKSSHRGARGLEVFLLSLTGPTDEAAMLLASRENASDFYDEEDARMTSRADQKMDELAKSGAFTESEKLAVDLMAELTRVEPFETHNRGIKKAGFYVLRTGKVPSVLLELGFISNSLDAKLLENESYRESLAIAICNGINRYFGLTEDFTVAYRKPKVQVHQVKKGESLSSIARTYDVSPSAIMEASGLKESDVLNAGDSLMIPMTVERASEVPPAAVQTPTPPSMIPPPTGTPAAETPTPAAVLTTPTPAPPLDPIR